jgi:cellulose synthase/poly-beta-1,6-N-acetylglucosamine synthase-like glycosyltransferase
MKRLFTILLCLLLLNTAIHACHAIRVLVGSPVRQKPTILKEFLNSLQQLKQDNISIDYCFIDDNDSELSSELLCEFAQQANHCIIIKAPPSPDQYICDELTHRWNDNLVWKVAQFKNSIIQKAILKGYDYLFLVDSDLVLNPVTIEHLMMQHKDIISEIFWTRWSPEQNELPNVWISDVYNFNDDFLKQLREPGVYSVGGLCGCTLISKKALHAGVNFNKIYNLTFWGEDRHLCIRAGALGFSLFADTHFPAYHIFRESELAGLVTFKKNNNLP